MNENQIAESKNSESLPAALPPEIKPAQTAVSKKDQVRDLLMKHRADIAQALPKHITAERLIRVALTAINTNPALLNCYTPSLIGCIFQAAQLGLMPDGAVGEGYLIPFRNNKKNRIDCQFIPGYRGLITLAYRSGQIISLQGRAVYKNDKFSYSFGLQDDLQHTPADGDRGELTHVYAVVRMKNGGYIFDVMTKPDVEDIRRMSKNPEGSTWKQHYNEMAIKSVIRKIAKRTPLSPELIQAVQLEEKVMVLGESQESSLLLLESMNDDSREEATENLEENYQDATEDQNQALNQEMKKAMAKEKKSSAAVQQTIEMIEDKKGKEAAK